MFKGPSNLAFTVLVFCWASWVVQTVKNLPVMWETWIRSLSWEDPLEEGMAIHSSILAWRIPWTEEPGRLPSMRLQSVRHDWASLLGWFKYSHFLSCASESMVGTPVVTYVARMLRGNSKTHRQGMDGWWQLVIVCRRKWLLARADVTGRGELGLGSRAILF